MSILTALTLVCGFWFATTVRANTPEGPPGLGDPIYYVGTTGEINIDLAEITGSYIIDVYLYPNFPDLDGEILVVEWECVVTPGADCDQTVQLPDSVQYGSELVFGLEFIVPEKDYILFSGPGSRNPGGFAQAIATMDGDGNVRVNFEDITFVEYPLDPGSFGDQMFGVIGGSTSVPVLADAGEDVTGEEGTAIDLRGSSLPAQGNISFAWTYEAVGSVDEGATCTFANAELAETTITCNDDGTYEATLTVSDGTQTASSSTQVVVVNTPPVVDEVAGHTESPIPVNTPIELTAIFSDAGANDTHSAVWNWGDGSTSIGTITQEQGSGTVSGQHAYTAAGTYQVQLTVLDDNDGQTTYTGLQHIEVADAPTMSAAKDIVVMATGLDGSVVTFELPAATDWKDNALPVHCSPAWAISGATFPIGATVVTCAATDEIGQTVSDTFVIRVVRPDRAPHLIVPQNIIIEAQTRDGVTYIYDVFVSSPHDSNPAVECDIPSGTMLPLGTHTITCTATDLFGNSTTRSFTVTVVREQIEFPSPPPPPAAIVPPALALPVNLVDNATGPGGAVVEFDPGLQVGTDLNPTLSCNPPPGNLFPIGETVVACTVTDRHGNRISDNFTVTIVGAEAQLRELLEKVRASDLEDSEKDSASIRLVLAGIATGRDRQNIACLQLSTFSTLIGTLPLEHATLEEWREDARRIQAVLDCGRADL